jgi:lysophospholipase L1-like esterase
MKTKICALAVAVLATFSRPASADPIAPPAKVVLVGDSLAEGMSSRFKELARLCGYSRTAFHRRGSTMENWHNKMEEIVKSAKPSLVVVSLGTNDSIAEEATETDNKKRVRKILGAIRSGGSKVLWILPPKLPPAFKHQEEVRRTISEELSPDEIFDSQQLSFERSEDGVHATARGYSQWMTSAWEKLTKDETVVKLPR